MQASNTKAVQVIEVWPQEREEISCYPFDLPQSFIQQKVQNDGKEGPSLEEMATCV